MSDGDPAGGTPAPRERKPWTVRNVAPRDKILFAREQRREPSAMEEYLWERLSRQPFGCKFRRQHPIGDFVLDCYCAQVRLAIEIDGPVHRARTRYDDWRDAQLQALGIAVWRVRDDEVATRMPEILGVIREASRRRREGEAAGQLRTSPSAQTGGTLSLREREEVVGGMRLRSSVSRQREKEGVLRSFVASVACQW